MNTKEEIEEYLSSKKLRNVVLPDNVNDIDQGSDTAREEKIGTKASLARAEYLTERNKKMQYGDKQAISEYMAEQTARNEQIKARVEQSRLDYELIQEEKARLAKEAKITDLDRKEEAEDIQKYERKRDKEIANIQDYFNSSDEFWEEYQNKGHTADESPAGALITTSDRGHWCCDIHRYQNVLESPTNDGKSISSSFTIELVENHFRKYPKPHLDALIQITNNKYSKLIEARKEQTLEDKDVAFKKELRQIDKIKTRTDGDWPSAARKLTKGDKARIRKEEEAQAEENRRIYGGLY
jgi:hypothetical protein